MRRTSTPTYVTSERRFWKNLDVASFRSALCSSSLCTANLTAKTLDADAMAAQYNQVMTTILDDLVPLKKTTYRVRQSDPWYDDECRSAKRSARKLERRYKRTVKTSKQSPSVSASELQARETWLQALKASHRLVEQKRRRFWRTEADNSTNLADDRCRSWSW